MNQRPRKTASAVPDAPVELPKKWRVSVDELLPAEMDAAMRAVGVKADEMDQFPMSINAAYAVALARRSNPRIPWETWKTIKVSDLEYGPTADLDDPEDPTERA
jgi:hypothetical protein